MYVDLSGPTLFEPLLKKAVNDADMSKKSHGSIDYII